MDNHPIPQDVTGFQFKLIGNMTIRQFAYVATGAVLAWIFLSSPIFILIKLPLVAFFAISGFSLAFLPIDGRPLDTMVANFIRALFAPNEYIFQKQGEEFLSFEKQAKTIHHTSGSQTVSKENLQAFLNSISKTPNNAFDQKEAAMLQNVASMMQGSVLRTPVSPQKQEEKPAPTKDAERKTESSEKQQPPPIKQAAPIKPQQIEPREKSKEYQQLMSELENTRRLKEELEKELFSLKNMVATVKTTPAVQTAPKNTAGIKRIPGKPAEKTIKPAVPDAPNVITGLVKDPRGNALANILVEVKDAEGNPVRAFKTNTIGQFESATPLLNGVYTINFDDPAGKQKFDVIEITLNGNIVQPLEAISQDQRELLRKALFAN